jgi:hypothetical protein
VEYNADKPFETLTYLSEIQSDLINRKWSLTDTILIGDVNIVARKKEDDDEHPRIYMKADYVLNMKEVKDSPGGIFRSIDGKIPGVISDNECTTFYARGEKLKIYMDGMEVNPLIPIHDLPSQMFDKVEYIKSGMFAGVNYKGGILFFYAKRGMKNRTPPPIKPQGMESLRVIGYTVSRKFYTPDYESPEEPEKKEDIRNTIWWNPLVRTDSTGVAIETFYQSDESGELKIVVEGVTKDGKLCRGVSIYSVKE